MSDIEAMIRCPMCGFVVGEVSRVKVNDSGLHRHEFSEVPGRTNTCEINNLQCVTTNTDFAREDV